jgi:hypothetical protein
VPELTRTRPGRSAISGYVAEVILCDVSGMALLSHFPATAGLRYWGGYFETIA